MDKPGYDVTIGTADFYLCAGFEHKEAFAVRMRLNLPHLIQIDDCRTVDALERAWIEAFFQILHGLAQDERVVGGVNAHIVTSRINPFDALHIDAENLAAIFDIDKLLKPR